MTNTLITDNTAEQDGGGFRIYGCSPVITNSNICCNSAGDLGGGFDLLKGSSPKITNCIIWGNTATNGPQFAMDYDLDFAGGDIVYYVCNPEISFSDVQGGQAAAYIEPLSGFIWDANSNIDLDPLFIDPVHTGLF